jgi:Transcription factor WhiB
MQNYDWDADASCKGYDTNLFFDKYEEDLQLRPAIDNLCSNCPIARECFARGVSNKSTGVWGGIYIDNGKISREFNRHRTKQAWAETWQYLTNDIS